MQKIVHCEVEGQAPIALFRYPTAGFSVVYGEDRTEWATAHEAFDVMRACIRHAAECAGLLDSTQA